MGNILDIISDRFNFSERYQLHLSELLSAYLQSGMAPPNLLAELNTGDEGKLYAHVWEAILYGHLKSRGCDFLPGRVTKAGQDGPDFCFMVQGQRIWIEATVTSPEGLPEEWLSPPKVGVVRARSMPHEAMLLRWTNALGTKREKVASYIKKGIILPDDRVVIAINACRLSDFIMDDHGVSQLPFAVEAVFPIGPLGIPISTEGKPDGNPTRMLRYSVKKQSGVEVPTANFLNPEYSRISAILGCIQKHLLDGDLRLTLVHNPLADNPIPPKMLGASREFVATPDGDGFLLEQLA